MKNSKKQTINENITFYVYRITALDSHKYYYGVSHVKKANATEDECLNDGYFGSGGNHPNNKFRNWENKYKDFLLKEILKIFNSKDDAYSSERYMS